VGLEDIEQKGMFSMSKIRAIVTDPNATGHLTMTQVDEPKASPDQALVRVAAVSLNRGEVRMALSAQSQNVLGWDLAGTVERPAANGSGPKAGARVVGRVNSGAWAELAAVSTDSLAELAQVSFSQAATLPVAGLTALHAIQKGGNLLARNVLVTGASGGVGLFAVELAQISGAAVVGLTRHGEYQGVVGDAGATHVVVGDDASGAASFGPFHLVSDGVGGHMLVSTLSLLARHGVCVNYGTTVDPEASFSSRVFFTAPGVCICGLILGDELRNEPASVGLARLVTLVADGRLHPHIGVEAPWDQAADVARRLMNREFPGKAVLIVT
jgi:NADPH2:quinone reductase